MSSCCIYVIYISDDHGIERVFLSDDDDCRNRKSIDFRVIPSMTVFVHPLFIQREVHTFSEIAQFPVTISAYSK